VKGYKLWNQVTRKIVYSHDVIFSDSIESTHKHEDESREGEIEKQSLSWRVENLT
jgi:hypothetical protein